MIIFIDCDYDCASIATEWGVIQPLGFNWKHYFPLSLLWFTLIILKHIIDIWLWTKLVQLYKELLNEASKIEIYTIVFGAKVH